MSRQDGASTGPNSQSRSKSTPNQPAAPRVGKPTVALRPDYTPTKANAAERATAMVRTQKRKQRILVVSLMTVAAVLLGGGLIAYNFVLSVVRDATETITTMMPTPVPVEWNPEGTAIVKDFPDWRQKEPINILLLGLDERRRADGVLLEEETRADTQIIVHIDPRNNTAAMMAIPRDLYVKIPGYGEGRINQAYQFGDRDKAKIPGGGPSLAMLTIKQNFGIQIDYYARVNFEGFARVIDALGGVTLDVPRPLVDTDYPLPNYGTTRIYIPAGIQHMDGKIALQYARSRHADSDIGRNYRQQQVLLGLRQQGLKMFKLDFDLLGKIDDMAQQLGEAITTDLQIEYIAALAQVAQEIGPEGIQTLVIEPPMVYEYTIPQSGAQVLMPDWNLIRPKVAELFADPTIGKEKGRVLILNGTTVNGLAGNARDKLVQEGVPVAAIASAANQGSYPSTVVTDYTGGTKPNTLAAILKHLGLQESAVEEGAKPEWAIAANGNPIPITQAVPTGSTPVDFVVTIGSDRVLAARGTPTPIP